MADEDKDSKTEMPTPQKIEDSRKKGQVAFSREVGSVVIVFGGALAFLSFGRSLAAGVIELTERAYNKIAQPNAPLDDLVVDLAILVGIPLAGIMIFLGALLLAASFAHRTPAALVCVVIARNVFRARIDDTGATHLVACRTI